ncbi:MAG: flavodoxin domain-containing protein [Pseudomonadota bacterium]
MATIQILVGTTSGNTEFLADHVADLLKQHSFDVELHYEPDLSVIDQTQPWLIFIASHGAGDYADSMLDFHQQLLDSTSLKAFPYSVIAIGESCYDTYCAAGRDIDQRLDKLGANRFSNRLEIDMLQDDPEIMVENQISFWIEKLRSYTQK